MDTTGTKQYDLFKLIVAIVLLLAFLFLLVLMFKPDGQAPPPPPPVTASATSTLLPPTATSSPAPTITDTPQPTFTSSPTIEPTATSTAAPTVTETPIPATESSDAGEAPAEVSVCERIAQSRLRVGMQVIILQRLNFRTSPGILNNRIATNIPGTRAEVVGGPSCTRYNNGGAYLWWQIKLPNGTVGWSAEASSFGTFYFIEPAK